MYLSAVDVVLADMNSSLTLPLSIVPNSDVVSHSIKLSIAPRTVSLYVIGGLTYSGKSFLRHTTWNSYSLTSSICGAKTPNSQPESDHPEPSELGTNPTPEGKTCERWSNPYSSNPTVTPSKGKSPLLCSDHESSPT